MTITIKIGQRVRVWAQGQPAPEEAEVLALDARGFPSDVEVKRGGERHRYRRTRVMFWLLVHDDMTA